MERQTMDQLLMRISDMIEVIQNEKGPISSNITPELLSEIDNIEKATEILSTLTSIIYPTSEFNQEELKKNLLESPNTDPKDKQIIKRSDELTRKGRTFLTAFNKALQSSKRKSKKNSGAGIEKLQTKERRKLFKPLGGDQKWIPL